jgi:GntR family transcriptional regulator
MAAVVVHAELIQRKHERAPRAKLIETYPLTLAYSHCTNTIVQLPRMSTGFNINTSDPTPLWAQLERAIRFAVATGQIRVGEQLPTVRQLAVELRINANTVAKVYAELEREGFVETRRGVGTFVRGRQYEASTLRDRERQFQELVDRFLAEAAGIGYSLGEVVDRLSTRFQKEKKNG